MAVVHRGKRARWFVAALLLAGAVWTGQQLRLQPLHAQAVASLQVSVDRADATYAVGDQITVCAVWTIIPPSPNGEIFVGPEHLTLTLTAPDGTTQLLLDAPATPSILGGISNTGLRPQCATATLIGPVGCWTATARLTLGSGAADQSAGEATALFHVAPAPAAN